MHGPWLINSLFTLDVTFIIVTGQGILTLLGLLSASDFTVFGIVGEAKDFFIHLIYAGCILFKIRMVIYIGFANFFDGLVNTIESDQLPCISTKLSVRAVVANLKVILDFAFFFVIRTKQQLFFFKFNIK